MIIASHFHRVSRSLYLWQAYDKVSRADLFSTAVAVQAGLFLVDPIQLEETPLARVTTAGPVTGIILTNANHFRCLATYLRRFSVPVFAHREVARGLPAIAVTEIGEGAMVGDELKVITLEGAGRGEIALHCQSDGGTLIIGDALIHFDPHGFVPLPDKYCENPKQMRRSLRKLVHYDVTRILFAHGLPILSKAHARLCALLDVDLENA